MPPIRRAANQPHVDNEGNSPQRKQSRKQMREDIQALQQQVFQAEEERQRTQREIQALRAQVAGRAGSVEAANLEDDAPNRQKLSKSEIIAWKKRAKIAGGRVAALYDPFISVEPLAGHRVQTHFQEILDEVKRAQDSDEELEDDYNPALYWDTPHFSVPNTLDVVRDMIYHLPKSPGNTWFEEWFQEKVHEGARKQRSALVHNVQTLYEKIFNITNKAFEDRSARPNLPEVQALQNFLHINEKDDDGNPNLDVFFKDVILVRVLRLMLLGKSAIRTGKRSPKARASYSKLWHVTHVTSSLLAYGATVIHFVLSSNPVFEVGAGTVNYAAWFHGRLHLLEQVNERHPEVYHNLIGYYNKEVFGIDSRDYDSDHDNAPGALDNGMGLDADDLEFLGRI